MITYELNFTGVSRLLYVIFTINLYSCVYQFRHLTICLIYPNLREPAVEVLGSKNTEARPTPNSKRSYLNPITDTPSTYTRKNIIIEANRQASPIGQTQPNLIPLPFM